MANTGKSFVKNFSSTLVKFSWGHLPLCCLWILKHCNTNSTAGLWFSCSQTQTNSGQEGNLVMIILIMYLQIFTVLDVSTDDILRDNTRLFCGSGSGLPSLRFN